MPAFEDSLMPTHARDSLYALVACFLALQSQDIQNQLVNVPIVNGMRQFTFEGNNYPVVAVPENDILTMPGVNVFFGNDVADQRKATPQIWHMPVMVHVCVKYGDKRTVGERLAMRIGLAVSDAFEMLGSRLQVYDFTQKPPVAIPNRFVSWRHRTRGVWRNAADPSKEIYTNRIWTLETRYAR
jgi:hypothetical protein